MEGVAALSSTSKGGAVEEGWERVKQTVYKGTGRILTSSNHGKKVNKAAGIVRMPTAGSESGVLSKNDPKFVVSQPSKRT